MFSFEILLTISLTLFAVIDVVGSLPVIISIKQHQRNFNPWVATLIAGVLMYFFLFAGEAFLNMMGVDVRSFALAGSIVIFVLAMEMILGINIFKSNPDEAHSGNFVPIAFPLIAGSGTLTTVISLRSVYNTHLAEIIIAILINLVVVFLVLRSMDWIERKIGKAGLAAIKKFFGVLLLAIAIKIFSTYVVIIP